MERRRRGDRPRDDRRRSQCACGSTCRRARPVSTAVPTASTTYSSTAPRSSTTASSPTHRPGTLLPQRTRHRDRLGTRRRITCTPRWRQRRFLRRRAGGAAVAASPVAPPSIVAPGAARARRRAGARRHHRAARAARLDDPTRRGGRCRRCVPHARGRRTAQLPRRCSRSDFWTDPVAVDDAIRAAAARATTGAPAERALRARARRRPRDRVAPPLHRSRRRREVPRRPARRRLAPGRRFARARRSRHASSRRTSPRCSTSGCSTLRRITWDAPAALLEKLIAYEAVHAIESWDDLKNRLDSDRRCYAFFHPAMPERTARVRRDRAHDRHRNRARAAARRACTRARARHASTRQSSIRSPTASPASPASTSAPRSSSRSSRRCGSICRSCDRFVDALADSRVPGVARSGARGAQASACAMRERELLPAAPARVLARLARHDWETDEAIQPALLALCARYLTTRSRQTVRSIRSRTSTSRTAPAWSASTGWPTRRPTGTARSFGLMANYLYEDPTTSRSGPRPTRRGARSRSSAAVTQELLATLHRAAEERSQLRRRCVAFGGRWLFRRRTASPSSPRNAGCRNRRAPSSNSAASSGSRSVVLAGRLARDPSRE